MTIKERLDEREHNDVATRNQWAEEAAENIELKERLGKARAALKVANKYVPDSNTFRVQSKTVDDEGKGLALEKVIGYMFDQDKKIVNEALSEINDKGE